MYRKRQWCWWHTREKVKNKFQNSYDALDQTVESIQPYDELENECYDENENESRLSPQPSFRVDCFTYMRWNQNNYGYLPNIFLEHGKSHPDERTSRGGITDACNGRQAAEKDAKNELKKIEKIKTEFLAAMNNRKEIALNKKKAALEIKEAKEKDKQQRERGFRLFKKKRTVKVLKVEKWEWETAPKDKVIVPSDNISGDPSLPAIPIVSGRSHHEIFMAIQERDIIERKKELEFERAIEEAKWENQVLGSTVHGKRK